MTANYPGFDHQPETLLKFIASSDIFTILLNNGAIIHYVPEDKNAFYKWLIHHKVEDIKLDNVNRSGNML